MRLTFALVLWTVATSAPAQNWTHFAADPARSSSAPDGPASLAAPAWVRGRTSGGSAIEYVGQSTPIVAGGRVFTIGAHSGADQAIGIDAASGEILWSVPVNNAPANSWSSAAFDEGNNAVIFATSTVIRALNPADGRQLWRCTLPGQVVNASPVVTTDMHPADRVFISDFSSTGTGRFYCINADPFDAVSNPHQPGAILWSVSLGWSSGNTPAYADRTVYVASISEETGASPGRIFAFPADASSEPAPLWVFTNVKPAGFFGGVSLRGGSLYAASYFFSGGIDTANLVKLDAATGALRWSVDSNRCSTTPVPLSDGRIVLSTGIAAFGSAITVQMFRDLGSSATREWDTATDTWNDTNLNGRMDPGEYFSVGGWNVQPSVCEARALLYAGSKPSVGNQYAPCDNLYALDLTRVPADPAFVVQRFAGAGSGPAIWGSALYTIGLSGLHAFNVCPADCDRSTGTVTLDIFDFLCFQNLFGAGDPAADCDPGTGARVLDIFDFLCFQNHFAQGCP